MRHIQAKAELRTRQDEARKAEVSRNSPGSNLRESPPRFHNVLGGAGRIVANARLVWVCVDCGVRSRVDSPFIIRRFGLQNVNPVHKDRSGTRDTSHPSQSSRSAGPMVGPPHRKKEGAPGKKECRDAEKRSFATESQGNQGFRFSRYDRTRPGAWCAGITSTE